MADQKYSQLPLISAVTLAQEWGCNDAGVSRRIRVEDLASFFFTRISGATGAAGPYKTLQALTANSADVTVTTPTTVMTTTGVGPGTWKYHYTVLYQAAATTTGISFVVAHTGAVSQYVKRWIHVTTGGAASTGIGDDIAGTNTGQIVEGHATNTNGGDEGPTAGVATANANVMAEIEGLIVVTTSGNLELRIRSEVAGSAVRIMAGSLLELTRII